MNEQLEQDAYRSLVAATVAIVCTSTQPILVSECECQHCLTLGINETTAICVACRKRLEVSNPAGITVTATTIAPYAVAPNNREELRSLILAEQLNKAEKELEDVRNVLCARQDEWASVSGSPAEIVKLLLMTKDRQIADANAKIAAFIQPVNVSSLGLEEPAE